MLIVDCSDYGPVGPYFIEDQDMFGYLEFAEILLATHSGEWIDQWMDNWEMALAWESVMEDSVGDQWYGRCLLVQAVAGLLGKRVPRVQVISR